MKAREVVGRRIVAIEQERVPSVKADDGFVLRPGYWHLSAIVLDNGTRITFDVVETDAGDYGLQATVRT